MALHINGRKCCTVQVYRYIYVIHIYENEKMLKVHVLYVFFTRKNRGLAFVMDRLVHAWTRTRSTHTTHTRIHHDHACIAVVHTRIAVSLAVRPRIA